MDQVTQQNAAMVEEATAATLSLKGETQRLHQLVGGFQVDRAEPEPRPAPRAVQSYEPRTRRVAAGGGRRPMAVNSGWEEF